MKKTIICQRGEQIQNKDFFTEYHGDFLDIFGHGFTKLYNLQSKELKKKVYFRHFSFDLLNTLLNFSCGPQVFPSAECALHHPPPWKGF